MSIAIETEQVCTIKVGAITDRRGKPATLDGIPQWATDNSDVITIEPAPDGLSCKVTTGIMPNPSVKVQMTGDADLGAGSAPIIGTAEFVITAPPATNITLTADTPADVPV